MPTVSIIIPTYNHAFFVKDAIDSALLQSYKDLEVLVIDDGSTDNTKEILSKYINQNKIRYYYQSNQGLSSARNTGTKLAQGAYVKYLDSDDFLFSLQIEKHILNLSQDPDPKAMSMTNFCLQGPSGKRQDVIVPMPQRIHQLAGFIETNRGAIHSYLFPKILVQEAGGFDEGLKACEDFDLKLKLLMLGAYIKTVDYIGCCYRLLDKSMSTDTLMMFKEKSKVYEKLYKHLLPKFSQLDNFMIERILNKNILLLDECLERQLNPLKILPLTVKMTSLIYNQTKSGFDKLFLRTVGLINYIKFGFSQRSKNDCGYRNYLLTQESAWKIK